MYLHLSDHRKLICLLWIALTLARLYWQVAQSRFKADHAHTCLPQKNKVTKWSHSNCPSFSITTSNPKSNPFSHVRQPWRSAFWLKNHFKTPLSLLSLNFSPSLFSLLPPIWLAQGSIWKHLHISLIEVESLSLTSKTFGLGLMPAS